MEIISSSYLEGSTTYFTQFVAPPGGLVSNSTSAAGWNSSDYTLTNQSSGDNYQGFGFYSFNAGGTVSVEARFSVDQDISSGCIGSAVDIRGLTSNGDLQRN